MAIARQPAHIRGEHRIRGPDPPEPPAHLGASPLGRGERLGILDLDPVICPDIDHHASAVDQPGEEVRSMTPATVSVMPAQPKRLGRIPDHVKIEVQQHRVIVLQPGLIPTCRLEVPTTADLGNAADPVPTEMSAPAARPRNAHPNT
jgi:hypothetical protein